MLRAMRRVRGILYRDYVRMLRAHRNEQYRDELTADDLGYLDSKIDPNGWYPMESFERLGNAILKHVTRGEHLPVRMWGRYSVQQLRAAYPMLIAERDPVETLNRFKVMQSTFFDFDALDVPMLHDGDAQIVIRYQMGKTAEEAASYQTMGFFEGLVQASGGADIEAEFRARSWEGAPRTLVELRWRFPARR
jgi:hypothetical protein